MHATSNFNFLNSEYPNLAKIGLLAERNTYRDPSTSLVKLRLLSERITEFILNFEQIKEFENEDQYHRIRLLEKEEIIPREVCDAMHIIRKSGNGAAHDGKGTPQEVKFVLRQTVKLVKWFCTMYEDMDIPKEFVEPQKRENDAERIKALEEELAEATAQIIEYQKKVQQLSFLTHEQKEERKIRASHLVRKIDESESETRQRIDFQLRKAGWECETESINYKRNKTLPEKGNYKAIAEWPCGKKWADYALFDGLELVGIVEAKKHNKNVMSVLNQAQEYSKLVHEHNDIYFPNHPNQNNYKVPFMFSTNGRPYLEQLKTASGIWFWDGRKQNNSPRALSDWFSPEELKDLLESDDQSGDQQLIDTSIDVLRDPNGLNLRDYQIDAIKAIEKKIIEEPDDRKSLIAMATGTGKTRTIIGMCYRLIESKRFRKILFLVDRRMLGKQAEDAFKEVKIENLQTFSELHNISSLKDMTRDLASKLHFATVQSMVKRIEYSENPPGIGEYDCIVVDEAHRGYILDKGMDDEELILRDQADFQSRYRKVLDYFDAYRIGLTATPAVHTEEIFGKPVYTYSYRKAVVDGYLIDFEPPYVFQTKLGQNGIHWDIGDDVLIYDPEENTIASAGSTEDEIHVEIQNFNSKVINDSFNRNILRTLIEKYNLHPDDKKKTLIFAVNNHHADMIVNILREEFEDLGEAVDEKAIKKITGEVKDRDDLLRSFKNDQYPGIVVTVDLLTTGIDVPSICNIVFMRRVNSRILYDQMMGRATRRCDEIGKEVFKVYDGVGVTEIMAEEQVMQPVAPVVQKKFVDLVEEMGLIEDELKKEIKLDRIIAKLHRKLYGFTEEQMENFDHHSGGLSVSQLTDKFRKAIPEDINSELDEYQELWHFLDREKGKAYKKATLYSDAEDQIEEIVRAYDQNLKPKDYIESFNEYIKNKQNEIQALKLICTNPSGLTRKDLKELKFILDADGYSKASLNSAYSEVSNREILADIIAHVRTAALGSPLLSHVERISKAMEKLREAHEFNSIQERWLERIESQLLTENLVTVEDLDKLPFIKHGGKRKIDKAFKNQTEELLEELNQYLYA